MRRPTALLVVSILGSCGGDSAAPPPAQPLVISKVSGDNQSVRAGEQAQSPLVVLVTRAGAPQPNISVSWSNEFGFLINTTDASGQAGALWTAGTQAGRIMTTTALVQDPTTGTTTSAVFAGTIVPGLAHTVDLSPLSASARIGDVIQFTATARDRYGNNITGRQFTWTAVTPSVISVDANGRAVALRSGVGQVQASLDNANYSGYVAISNL